MVTLAILAVLVAVALPSYLSYVLRSHRSDAMATLAQDQAILERCYAQNYAYSAACLTLPASSPQGYYSIAMAPDSLTPSTYKLTATPTGSQAADTTCALIAIDQANTKTAFDANNVAQPSCWNP